MLSAKLDHRLDKVVLPVVRLLARAGLTPNNLTIAGALTSAVAAAALLFGHFRIGGILILLGGVFDLLDGALARVVGQQTRFGAVLDSTLDRYSDVLPILGLMLYYSGWTETGPLRLGGMMLCGAVILGSLLVPYVRARAELMIERCDIGIAERAERILILSGGLVIDADIAALWILAILTHFTVFQRLWFVRKQLKQDEEAHNHVERPNQHKLAASDLEGKL
ncbi:MAG: CDP-alcohol phosphatidyltransferase family protein [Candidatus Abyssobacteria bacterium SURF_5]|uniref:CDP-alcohol phosphatidyltransferase family protein n=1 Tax=Abyssobacteria bacterium (strain SURF_5) TaxID=2093360 RepID=A0A3A4NCD0_ABYX5|nr:MAG: CDP-alcohol phosphatidyltransferase family protein [Candidatus Abyssubacteria bacterium SURF_5]